MVRVHLLQVSLNLSDPEMESYLASDMVARSFCRVSSTRLFISDSTILRFRHFIDQYGLAQKFLERTVNLAVEAGACSFEMVAADGTFIEAPSSIKNKAHARDPEMASGKKANTWHFGMKEHIAACSESGIIYGTVAAPANEHDITAREHESGTVFLAKWNDRRSSWNGLWPMNSRKTERLSRQSGTFLSQTGTLP